MKTGGGLPPFMVVGAAKCGTTSIFNYLNQHPEIFIPSVKETFFFISSIYKEFGDDPAGMPNVIFNLNEYRNLFSGKKNKNIVGEVATYYLYYYETSIPMIKKTVGDIKILAILRNPVDRAYSAYRHFVRDYFEPLTFEQALIEEPIRKNKNWDAMWFYKDLGFYYKQVKAYKENFSKVKIIIYEEFERDPKGMMKEMYEFLDVKRSFNPNINVKYNPSGVYKWRSYYNLIKKPNIVKRFIRPFIRMFLNEEQRGELSRKLLALNLDEKSEIRNATREILMNDYAVDILKLQTLIGKNLAPWLRSTL